MDVNVNSEIKGFVATAVAPAVEREEKQRAPVTPVAPGLQSSAGSLGDKELHRRNAERRQNAVSAEELAKAVEEIQSQLDAMGTRLNFALNKEPAAVVVKVTDRQSGELIRQIPAEEVLALRKKLQELNGLLFDEKA